MKWLEVFGRKNRILLRELVVTDFKLRYQGSALGYVWSILKPLFLFSILYVVFDKFLGVGRNIQHFPVYLLLGIILWNFFVEATNQGLNSIVSRGDLLRKINFPKYIVVISGTVSSLINLLFNMAVVLLFIIVNGVQLSWASLLIIPLIVELYIFALGIAFFLSALNVKSRDTGYLWEVFTQAAFYATPVIYPLQMVLQKSSIAVDILFLNPVAQIIQDSRYVLITKDSMIMWNRLSPLMLSMPFIVIIVVVMLAVWYFKKCSKTFAEEI
jgi:ABC-type polysaccharide/polyol phosphate export system, permease component